MVCKQCGAYSEAGMKFCTVCGAPQYENRDSQIANSSSAADVNEDELTESGRPSWGFVRSPRWPKPTFDINNIDTLEEHIQDETPTHSDTSNITAGNTEAPSYGQPNVQPQSELYNESSKVGVESTSYEDSSYGFNPQPIDSQTADYSNQPPFASVGGYEDGSAGYQGRFGRAPQHATVYSMDDDLDEPSHSQYAKPQKTHSSTVRSIKRMPASRSEFSAPRSAKHNNNTIFLIAVSVLLVLLVVFGVMLINKNYGTIGGFFKTVFGGSPILKSPEIEEGLNDEGIDCYIITVHAREGNTITVRVGVNEQSGIIGRSNQKAIRIPKASLLPDTPVEGETADVIPDVRITTKDGEVYQLDIPAVPVNVPKLALSLTTPASEAITVTRSKVLIEGTVDVGTDVFVEGQKLETSADGEFSGEYNLPELGVYTLSIEAKKNGYQIARKSIDVDYSQAAANIKLDKSTLRTTSETAVIKGETDPGATMEVRGPENVILGTPNVNAATGFFSFSVQLPAIGAYELDVSITKGGLTTAGSIFVERAPDYAAYTASVHRMDYSRMTKETLHKAAYKCVGKAISVLQTEPYVVAKLETSSGELIFEYHNNAASIDAGDGKTYNVFGDYKGLDKETGLPLIYAWFITKTG